ncbi:uncharacterized protein METZ01_LOCUS514807, partial [marine metagenome]
MKPTLIALVALSLCLLAAGTDLGKDGFRGRVKSVKNSRYKITEKFGKPIRVGGGVVFACNYDKKGNKLQEMKCDSAGKPVSNYTYMYDDNGNQLEWA